jgi:predicted DsbA family dithiol-disulfide isomerase
MNDILFEIARESDVIDVRELAAQLAMDPKTLARSVNDQAARRLLQHDILSALKLQIDGTPAYVINGNVYLAQIPPEIIKNALKR